MKKIILKNIIRLIILLCIFIMMSFCNSLPEPSEENECILVLMVKRTGIPGAGSFRHKITLRDNDTFDIIKTFYVSNQTQLYIIPSLPTGNIKVETLSFRSNEIIALKKGFITIYPKGLKIEGVRVSALNGKLMNNYSGFELSEKDINDINTELQEFDTYRLWSIQ